MVCGVSGVSGVWCEWWECLHADEQAQTDRGMSGQLERDQNTTSQVANYGSSKNDFRLLTVS